jgi:hypothetical protein
MAWTSPMTASSGSVFTASQFNTNVRDNLNQTGPALVSAAGQILVSTAANTLAARQFSSSYVPAAEAGAGTALGGNLPTGGPAVTVTTGIMALVAMYAQMFNSVAADAVYTTYAVTGATTIVDTFDRCIGGVVGSNPGMLAGAAFLQTGLTPGSNTFTMHYAVAAGTGTWTARRMFVMPL